MLTGRRVAEWRQTRRVKRGVSELRKPDGACGVLSKETPRMVPLWFKGHVNCDYAETDRMRMRREQVVWGYSFLAV